MRFVGVGVLLLLRVWVTLEFDLLGVLLFVCFVLNLVVAFVVIGCYNAGFRMIVLFWGFLCLGWILGFWCFTVCFVFPGLGFGYLVFGFSVLGLRCFVGLRLG